MTETGLLLLTSIVLSSGRALLSKRIAERIGGGREFFFSQTLLFGAAAVLLTCGAVLFPSRIDRTGCVLGVLYGVFLVLSQWMYTFSLKNGSTSVCTVVYSLGFVLPALCGVLFWKEPFRLWDAAGLVLALAAILLTGKRNDTPTGGKTFLPFLLIAMAASGSLGILQKVQQHAAAGTGTFLFLAVGFAVAFLCSGAAFFICRDPEFNPEFAGGAVSFWAGLCFGGANLCNTLLAGRMNSIVFFPVQNVSVLLSVTFLGILLFREKTTLKTGAILVLGIAAVIFFQL